MSRIDKIEKRNHAIARFLNDASMYSQRVAHETIEAQRQDIEYLLSQLKDGGAEDKESSRNSFYCEHCNRDFTGKPHATDDEYWLCDPCWVGLQGEQGICECRCHGYHEIRAASCKHCSTTAPTETSAGCGKCGKRR